MPETTTQTEDRSGAATTADAPAVGTVIRKTFKGHDLILMAVEGGYMLNGTTYPSLTAAARVATGYPAISGPVFWGTGGAAQSKIARLQAKVEAARAKLLDALAELKAAKEEVAIAAEPVA